MNKLKNKLQNSKINFSKNLVLNLIVPAVLVIVALVVGIVFGFNKGLDFNGGLMVSVVADTQDLNDGKEYAEFKAEVDEVLAKNKLGGSVYIIEKDSVTYKDILVVKIAYNGTDAQTEEVVSGLKSDLISSFYAEISESEINLRNLVIVSTFGPSVDSWTIIASLLATIIAVLLICVYVGLRNGLDTAVLTLLSSVVSTVLSFALIMLSRIQINAPQIALIPLVSIVSAIMAFMFVQKAKNLAKSDEYTRKPNFVLANNTIKSGLYGVVLVAGICLVLSLAFALVNILNPVLWFGLSVFAGILALTYTNLFVTPAIFALTFVRRVKKEKAKKEQKTEKLNEEEVLKETDLDNLVSN